MRTNTRTLRVLAPALLAILAACGGGSGDGGATPLFDSQKARAAVETYAQVMYANLCDIEARVLELQTAVNAFVAAPSAQGLQDCKDAWRAGRLVYQPSEIGRFYDGPIDRAPDGPEGQINAWPLDENYIDYISTDANAGLINDPVGFPTIDTNTIAAVNEQGGETNISTGWHAIEFLLWGQDLTPPNANMAGQRPWQDFMDAGGTAPNEDRRRDYLVASTNLLLSDIQSIKAEWAPNGAYRQELLSVDVEEALSRIMTGMGSLAFGELRGERLFVPFTTKLQEDEHSCFSDLTHHDHRLDVVGIQNAWLGRYDSSDGNFDVSGTGLDEVVASADQTLANQITGILETLVGNGQGGLGAPALVPFDAAIEGADNTPGRQALQAAMDQLSAFNDAFSQSANTMGISILTELQD